MRTQITNKVLMVRPVKFYFNEETAVNNAYQKNIKESLEDIQKDALNEFNNLVTKIQDVGITVNILQDTPTPSTPDCIFPNNWFSSHQDKKLLVYPMFAPNRRLERKKFLTPLKKILNTEDTNVVDLTHYEKENKFLEGTGALVLDRVNQIAYCCLSPRANEEVLNEFCNLTGYAAVKFNASQEFNGKSISIYHTNVMMGVTEKFVVICLDSIKNLTEKENVKKSILTTGKKIIDISLDQVLKFCGNILELKNNKDERFILMSETAFNGFTKKQLATMEESSKIIYSDINTIETCGGGSVRCMIAELF